MEKLFKNFKNGRPKRWKSVKKLQNAIERYVKSCFEQYIYYAPVLDSQGKPKLDDKNTPLTEPQVKFKQIKPLTITGMCMSIDCSRQTLSVYADNPKFTDTIRKARLLIEQSTEEGISTGSVNAQIGIFSLKNNFNWKDKTEVENTMKVEGVKEINYIKPIEIEKPHDQNAAPIISPSIIFEKPL